ncbi:patatin-like phospholipase family protein [Carnobacterium gallinarum]|uniref:patatin-like phospholipase family protein n=1 Tax=Carnobacterium gallinarum TaxID=2749 RepID=UPI00054EB616|nr:patatin-like phospholipase family protein [Carnobacterium gallinarum]
MTVEVEKKKKTALVLGGGGARGAYQIGVWQALIELGIKFEIVTGTSVGALNGGLIVQGDYEAALEMWQQIETNHVLEFETPVNATSFRGYQQTVGAFIFNAFRKKGISASPLKETIIEGLLDEERMRSKKIDFGIALTEFPSMRQKFIFLDEIPKGLVSSYLLGSASFFPAMQPTRIGEKLYVDGGYHDNIPIDLALSKGATNLIVVDVKGPGITKSISVPADCQVQEIVSKWPLGAVLLFDGARSKVNINLGYLETLKSYQRLSGSWYSFKNADVQQHQKHFYQAFRELLNQQPTDFVSQFVGNEKNQEYLLKRLRSAWRGRIGKLELSYALHELTAKMLHIEPTKIYRFPEFNQLILTKIQQLQEKNSVTENELEMIYSGEEWLDRYSQEIPFISDQKMVLYFVTLLENNQEQLSQSRNLQWLIYRKPVAFMMAAYLYYLRGKLDE